LIYFIEAESGHIKIGYTDNEINVRIKAMQPGCPFTLKLIKTIDGDRQQEKLIHKKFTEYRYRGEWFIPSKEIQSFIKNPYVLKVTNNNIQQLHSNAYEKQGFFKEPEKEIVSFNIRRDQLELLKKIKKETGLSISKIIGQLIDIYFEEDLKIFNNTN